MKAIKIEAPENSVLRKVLAFYAIIILITLFDSIGVLPFGTVIRKMKYVYLAVIIAFNFVKIDRVSKQVLVVFGLFMFHTLLFGIAFKKSYLSDYTNSHMVQMITFLIFVFLTARIVYYFQLQYYFIKYSFYSLALFLVFCLLRNFSDIVNPIYYFRVFSNYSRIRSQFGMGDYNNAGSHCCAALILSVFLLYEMKQKYSLSYLNLWYYLETKIVVAIDLLVVCMLFSTASRTSLFCFFTFIVFVIYKFLCDIHFITSARKIVIACLGIFFIIILFSNGLMTKIWLSSNRVNNVTVNYNAFLMVGNLWTGMGYVESSAFLNGVYGVFTWPVDMYYVYIFFSSGLIGSVIIFGVMIYMTIVLFRVKDSNDRRMFIALYLSMLVAAISEVNFFTYRFNVSMIYAIMIVYALHLPKKGHYLVDVNI